MRDGVEGDTDDDDDESEAIFLSAPGAALPENGLLVLLFNSVTNKSGLSVNINFI